MAATVTLTSALSITDATTGEQYELSSTRVISYGTHSFDKRQLLIPTSVVNVLAVAAAVAQGTFTDLDFMIIINRDTANFITLGIKITGGDTFYVKLRPGEVYYVNNRQIDANTTGAAFVAFGNLDTITAQADTAACILEYLALDY